MQTVIQREATNLQRVTRILVVEDCKSDVVLLEQLLEDANIRCFYETTDVPRLIDAFYKLDRESFDLIMLDLNLIDMDGVMCVAALHAQVPTLPIIVYSGVDDPKIKETALLCGASYYFVKGKETGESLKHIIEHAVL